MTFKKLSRLEKEKLYNQKMIELQRIWGNPIESDWQFDWEGVNEEEIDKELNKVCGQIRFEKTTHLGSVVIKYVLIGFISLGIIGLLVFGIRQLL